MQSGVSVVTNDLCSKTLDASTIKSLHSSHFFPPPHPPTSYYPTSHNTSPTTTTYIYLAVKHLYKYISPCIDLKVSSLNVSSACWTALQTISRTLLHRVNTILSVLSGAFGSSTSKEKPCKHPRARLLLSPANVATRGLQETHEGFTSSSSSTLPQDPGTRSQRYNVFSSSS